MRLSEMQVRMKDMMMGGLEPEPDFAAVCESGNIALADRLSVYRGNIMGSLGRALRDNFPLLEKLVGENFLKLMVGDYIRQTPPTSGCLDDYGLDFDRFVESYELAAALPYLPDMARLEILTGRATRAKDDEALTPEYLAAVPEAELEHLNFRLRDSVHILKSHWPVDDIRALCLGEVSGETLDINKRGVCLLVCRPEMETEIAVVSEGDYAFLNAIQTRPFGSAVAETMESHPDFNLQSSLPRFMTLKIFLKLDEQ